MEMAGLPMAEAAPARSMSYSSAASASGGAAPPVKLATPQDVPEPVSPASASSNTVQDPAQRAQASTAASSGMKPSIGGAALKGQTAAKTSSASGQFKPVTKSATPQAVDEPVKPVREDQMAHSLMRELHNFKY
jgi:hypothetical protein